jgi:hypothetical protein
MASDYCEHFNLSRSCQACDAEAGMGELQQRIGRLEGLKAAVLAEGHGDTAKCPLGELAIEVEDEPCRICAWLMAEREDA